MTTRPVRIGLQLQPQHADYATIRATAAAGRGTRRRHPVQLGPLLPAVRRARRQALRVLDHARRLGGGRPPGSRSAPSSPATATATRSCSPTWPAPSTTSATAGSSSASARAGSRRTTSEYGYEFGTAGGRLDDLAEALPRIESRWAKLNPAPTRKIPVLIGGGGEKKTLRLVAKHADIWHTFGDAGRPSSASSASSRALRRRRPRPGRDRGLGRRPGRAGGGRPDAAASWASRCSPSASAAPTTT